MRMGISTGMDMGMSPGMMMEKENFIMGFFHSLPLWAQGIVLALAVIIVSWIAGIIIGKLYASVKYPDPEKPSLVNPLLKIGLGVAVIACGFWIYSSFTKPDVPEMPVENPDGVVSEEISPDDMPEGANRPPVGGLVGGAIAVAEPVYP